MPDLTWTRTGHLAGINPTPRRAEGRGLTISKAAPRGVDGWRRGMSVGLLFARICRIAPHSASPVLQVRTLSYPSWPKLAFVFLHRARGQLLIFGAVRKHWHHLRPHASNPLAYPSIEPIQTSSSGKSDIPAPCSGPLPTSTHHRAPVTPHNPSTHHPKASLLPPAAHHVRPNRQHHHHPPRPPPTKSPPPAPPCTARATRSGARWRGRSTSTRCRRARRRSGSRCRSSRRRRRGGRCGRGRGCRASSARCSAWRCCARSTAGPSWACTCAARSGTGRRRRRCGRRCCRRACTAGCRRGWR